MPPWSDDVAQELAVVTVRGEEVDDRHPRTNAREAQHLGRVINLIALQVGGSTDVVEVTGAPPVVDTTSTQLGAIVNASMQQIVAQQKIHTILRWTLDNPVLSGRR